MPQVRLYNLKKNKGDFYTTKQQPLKPPLKLFMKTGFIFLILFLIFWVRLLHTKVPRPGTEPEPQVNSKQCWILNPLSHQ